MDPFIPAVAAIALAVTGAESPPPLAPSACTELFCADFYPLVLPSERRMIPATVSSVSVGQQRGEMTADYPSKATLFVAMAVKGAEACAKASAELKVEDVSPLLIRFEQAILYRSRFFAYDRSLRCRVLSGTVSVADDSVSPRQVLGHMMHVWVRADGAAFEIGDALSLPYEKRIDLARPSVTREAAH